MLAAGQPAGSPPWSRGDAAWRDPGRRGAGRGRGARVAGLRVGWGAGRQGRAPLLPESGRCPPARPLPDPHAVPRTSPTASAAMLLLLALCWGLPLCAGSLGEARSWGDPSEQVSGNLGGPREGPGRWLLTLPTASFGRVAAGQAPLTSPGRHEGREHSISWHIVPPFLLRSPTFCEGSSLSIGDSSKSLDWEVSCRAVPGTSGACRTRSSWLLLSAHISASFFWCHFRARVLS